MKTETNKSLIKAICEGYTPNIGDYKPYFADHIQGKGEGQILLLHGPPGTGKTLTAGRNVPSPSFFDFANTIYRKCGGIYTSALT